MLTLCDDQCWCGILLHYISCVISCIMLLDFEKNNAVLDVFLEIERNRVHFFLYT